jgi:purine-binding chemotaxis protein CheW
MDIAKIRKKLKESGADTQQPKIKAQAEKPQEEIKPDEKSSAPVPLTDKLRDKPDMEQQKAEPDIRQEPEASDEEKRKEEKKSPKVQGIEEQLDSETEEIVEILTFSLLKEEYAFGISQLHEILRHQWITEVPNVPDYILGITSLRGKVIPVIDLKLKLSLTDKPSYERKGKILILKDPRGPIGVTVDKVIGVVRTSKSEILPPPSHLSETQLKFINGIAVVDKRFVSIINMEEAVALHLQ